MAKGNEIIVSAEPCGRFLEGIVYGTPKPGTVMQLKAATEPVGGRFTWEVANYDADGDQRLVAVLLPDQLQGKTATDAYVSGERCFLYCPLPGDELNMLVTDINTGTSDTFAIGDLLMVDDGTGKLVDTTGTPESESFLCLETYADPTSTQTDFLLHCMYTGH
jgi:hypothetical protein